MSVFCDLILIVDDNRVSNFFNKTIMEQCKIAKKVITIDNSELAYNFINPKKSLNKIPDVVFLDLYMPNMNGWELLDELNTLENVSEFNFVIMCNQDLLPEEKIKLNQYSFVKAITDKNLTNNLVTKIAQGLFFGDKKQVLKYS